MRNCNLIFAIGIWLAAAAGLVADEDFSLVIDPISGSAELRNDTSTDVAIDSYFITSPTEPTLQIDQWSSLEANGMTGWRATSADNRLGELNLAGSLIIPGNGSVSIGTPYVPFTPAELGEPEPGLSTLNFTYTLADESSQRRGDVEFSARNTLVLVVDVETGESSLVNQSAFDVNLDSYLIKSIPSVLDTNSWQPLAATDDAWLSANGAGNRIAEGNLFGSTVIPSQGSLSLGSAVDPALLDDEHDLGLEFTTVDFPSTILGGVLFQGLPDVTCDPSTEGDLDGNGTVEFADFLILSGNFGQTVGGHEEGDIDCNGTVEFADFLVLSGNFGQAVGVAAVPEPSSATLSICLAMCLLPILRRKRS